MTGRSRRLALLAVCLPALALPAASSGAPDGYKGFVGLFGDPVRSASQGAGWTANFEEKDRGSVTYKVCLKHLDPPTVKRCWVRSTGANGRSEIFVALYVNDVGGAGEWKARWKVAGKVVEKWRFKVRPEGV